MTVDVERWIRGCEASSDDEKTICESMGGPEVLVDILTSPGAK